MPRRAPRGSASLTHEVYGVDLERIECKVATCSLARRALRAITAKRPLNIAFGFVVSKPRVEADDGGDSALGQRTPVQPPWTPRTPVTGG